MDYRKRLNNYMWQNAITTGRKNLTPKQKKRLRKKVRA